MNFIHNEVMELLEDVLYATCSAVKEKILEA